MTSVRNICTYIHTFLPCSGAFCFFRGLISRFDSIRWYGMEKYMHAILVHSALGLRSFEGCSLGIPNRLARLLHCVGAKAVGWIEDEMICR